MREPGDFFALQWNVSAMSRGSLKREFTYVRIVYTTDGLSSSTLTEEALEDGLGELEAGGISDGDGDLCAD